ncbi:MAG TPA: N-acylglucosamine 2-epimerase [Ruminococcus sp.]|nr:N-acylglucosamine 2-epimerase [Ruminococcus sp.]
MDKIEMMRIAGEIEQELRGHILPFWLGLRDDRGGFMGRITPDLQADPAADKGMIYHARILWAFSSAYLKYQDPAYLSAAAHAYTFLRKGWDIENGGFYWTLTVDGAPAETAKYCYCNAFCIYGLTLYAEASGDMDAMQLAEDAFDCIETHFAEPNGYIESCTADWQPLENDHLSEHDLHAAKTMNTTLHLIEAYAELYRVCGKKNVAAALRKLIELYADRIYLPEKQQLGVFYDSELNLIGDLYSYGHDIEASWLVDHACDCLGSSKLTGRLRKIDFTLAERVSREAFYDGAFHNECFSGETDRTRVWWVQAEGVIGCLNAAQSAMNFGDSGNADRYLNLAAALWNYIQSYQIDRRPGGEWYAETDKTGQPLFNTDTAGIWKCPYHNTRMCLEAIRRIHLIFGEK